MPLIRVYIAQSHAPTAASIGCGRSTTSTTATPLSSARSRPSSWAARVTTSRSFGEWPYPGARNLVVTSRQLDDAPPNVTRVGADIPRLAAALRASGGKDAWVMGGAMTINAFLQAGAIDRIDLFTVPVLLGDGIPLFAPGRPETALKLMSAQTYDKGLARQSYVRA